MKISKKTLLSKKGEGEGKLMRCYRIHITPSKIYCLGPEEEVSNYVVKYHSEYASDFARVTFVDEDWSKLSPNALSARVEQGFFSTPLKTGLYHRVLSILKEGFCIGPKKYEFLAFSASQLRGNSVWMFASNNSLSAESIRNWMGHFKDIRSVSKCAARMGQLFSSSRQTCEVSSYDVEVIPDIEVTTDGTKYIFSDGIGKISSRFARKIAKIIGLDPNNPPSAFQIRYGGYKGVIAVDPTSFFDLSLRPSMKKFESKSTMLNITNWSKSQPCYVNREIISLLSTLGKLDYGQVYIRITKNRKEQKYSEQPFFCNDDGKTAVIVGKVAISKNPCLHPGDVRVLEAIYDPGLDARGLIDCVVFPQKGDRPHPNECSGGDLDGDLFFITWDDKLIPEKVDTPMDYAATRPHILDHFVTLEEIQKHFVSYMINDALGAISTAHLIHADRNPLKARSPECIQLAALHSMAVDFAKTGAPAEMPWVLRPREFPDFMERWEKPMYVSDGVLGKLYRAAVRHAENAKALLPGATPSCAYDPDLECPGFPDFLDAAEEHYEAYAEKLGTLMTYYSAEREDEILTGNIQNKLVYLRRDNKRYFEMKDRIIAAVDALHAEVRGWLRSRRDEDASRLASAWYHVTYHPDRRGEKRFWSFPWIACDTLLAIKAARRCRKRVEDAAAAAVPMDCDA
ncbi:hypothetical protein HU200_032177 [Digitaria exilis]|uniref:RNA-dependent RNA polymerase n=1 Tax=Digitaria exilis TaxID=1010633 RepID=A0A835EP47_9POAL|nr:hypothetical protein HU200_032177 [Digitaria exilis]